MARSPNCYRCGELKGEGYENYGYCKTCKHAKRAEERATKRAETGLRPWGLGPNPICKDCGKTKEDPRQCRCNECRSAHDRAKRRERGLLQNKNNGRCPCGAERANDPYYCPACKSAYQKKLRDAKRPPPEELAKAKAERYRWAKFRKSARKYTESCINIGMLIKQPCEVCGTNEDVEAHHDDYFQPFQVRWLCRTHHLEHHVKIGDFKRG